MGLWVSTEGFARAQQAAPSLARTARLPKKNPPPPPPPPPPPTFACNVNTEHPKCYIANKNTLFPGGRSEELCMSTTLPSLAMSTRIIHNALPQRLLSGFVNIDRDPSSYKKRYLAQPINVSTQKKFNTFRLIAVP